MFIALRPKQTCEFRRNGIYLANSYAVPMELQHFFKT
jgi:hypothetical protein